MMDPVGRQLPRPVQVWVLDTVPGDVWCEAGDHPRDTINFARTIPMPIATRKDLVDSLTAGVGGRCASRVACFDTRGLKGARARFHK